MTTWLEETRQLDLSNPKLRITAQKLTQSHQCLHARAGAIHAFVRRMPFTAVPHSPGLRASEVLARGAGDCHSKGLLFVALCRAAGLPARMLFVRVNARFLAGMLDHRPDTLVHAIGQVKIGERWVSTDGYVVDPVLFALAKQSLRAQGLDSGWGIVHDARGAWDGRATSIQQFRACDLVETIGAYADLEAFERAQRPAASGWLSRLKYAVGARLVNRRVSRLRERRAPIGMLARHRA